MFEEKTIDSKHIFTGKIITVKQDTVELPNGKKAIRDLVNHPGGVGVVPIDNDGKIYMVRQFRKPFNKELLEIPAGKLEKGEDHRVAGLRELSEEVGVSAESFEYMGYILPSPGFLDEIVHLYVAKNLKKTAQNLDEDEFLNVEKYSKNEILDMIKNGEIVDGKTVAGLLRAIYEI